MDGDEVKRLIQSDGIKVVQVCRRLVACGSLIICCVSQCFFPTGCGRGLHGHDGHAHGQGPHLRQRPKKSLTCASGRLRLGLVQVFSIGS